MNLYPGKTPFEVAEKAADFFSAISNEYEALQRPPENIDPPELLLHEVAAKLKFCKKPKSRVYGDIDPRLVVKFADLLAIPLLHIYNMVLKVTCWPKVWKRETVKLIPKSGIPESVKDLRNISCTPLFSKVLEQFVLKNLRENMELSSRQYGGIKGSSIDHFLCGTWHEILTHLEDREAAVSVMSVDFAKAFNRMDHGACLRALARAGVPSQWINVVHAFLYQRIMSVHVKGVASTPRSVPGGAPQGSVLGSFLFCATTDSLDPREHGSADVEMGGTSTSFERNGVEAELSSNEESLSPIHPPDGILQMGELSFEYRDSEEDEPFMHGRGEYARLLDSTVHSFRGDQSDIDDMIGEREWSREKPTIKAYVDDYNVIEKVRTSGAVSHFTEDAAKYKVHAISSERIFEDLEVGAGELGLIVNPSKTQLLCIHPSGKNMKTYITTREGDGSIKRIESADELKIVGFFFGPKPDVSRHVDYLVKKFNVNLWSLRFLKRSGMSQSDLLFVYKNALRPVLDFAAPSYNSILTMSQKISLEQLQLRSAKVIFGENVSYRTVLDSGHLESLQNRRDELTLNFARKTVKNERYRDWFPLNREVSHDIRRREKYFIPRMSTDRAYKSPVICMRRLLNEDHK